MTEYGGQRQRSGDESSTPVDASGVLAELVDEAVVRLDVDGTVRAANSRFEILSGRIESALVGRPLSAVVDDGDAAQLAAVIRALATRQHGEQTALGVSLDTDGGETVACQLSLAVAARTATGTDAAEPELLGTVRPIDTAEAELRRRADQQAAVATLGQLAVETDDIDALMCEAARLVAETLDCAYCKVLDLDPDREQLLLRQGVGWNEGVVGTATVDSTTNSQAGFTLLSAEPVIVEDLDSETRFTGPTLLTAHDVTSGISVVIGTVEAPWGILGVHDTRHRRFTDDDVNFVQSVANVLASAIDRDDRTRELRRYERIIDSVTDGVYTVDPAGRFTMVNDAFCELTGYDREALLGAHGSLVVDDDVLSAVKQAEGELVADRTASPTVEGDIWRADGTSVTAEATFALLPSGDSWERVGVARDVSERKAYERRLESKRTKLAALNEVNTVVREITKAIIDQSTRSEIEQLVCESLASFDSYRFAWIGEVDAHSRTIQPRAEADTDDYLDGLTISVDPADPMSRGPAGRAVETQELQVTQDVFTDPQFGPWRAIAREYDYRSVAVIPITYEGTQYGVLSLYSDVSEAFSAEKQAIIRQLGEIVGHAIAAVERKQALMSDSVTELEFEIRDVFSAATCGGVGDGEISLDRVIPVGGDSYLQYGRATADMLAPLQRLVAQDPSVDGFSVLEDSETEISFEMCVTEPPVTSVVADVGGSIEQATIRDNHFRVTVQLPQTASVREVLDRVRHTHPTARAVARRQVSRSEQGHRLTAAWTERLTDRQRASLEAAYFAGFFEWPRHSSGTDLADSMGVSPATFHQHLRTAERKLFGVLFDDRSEPQHG